MADIVTSYADVVHNVQTFNEQVHTTDLQSQVAQFRHWYCIPELRMFGPSKFVGYKNMTAALYNRGHRVNHQLERQRDGRITEKALKTWFVDIGPDHPEWIQLYMELSNLFPRSKKPNKRCRIHLPTAALSLPDVLSPTRGRWQSR